MDGSGEPSCSPIKPSQAPADSAPHSVFGRQEFKPDERNAIRELLQQKLGKEHLATRPGSAGVSFTYVESWKAIELANQIFGFNGWSSAVVDITPDYIEQSGKGRYSVGVTAVVKVMLKDGTYHEDVGYGMAEHPKKGSAIENAKKEAVSDARKRALRLFGNALGNCLYDKEHLMKLKSAKKGEAGYLPPTVSNPAHDAEKATVSYEQPVSLPPPAQPTFTQPPPSLKAGPVPVPGGYNANTANIAGGRPQPGFPPQAARGPAVAATPLANGHSADGRGEIAPTDYTDGYDDDSAFLSIAMSESQQHGGTQQSSPPVATSSPQFGHGMMNGGAKRSAPDTGFGFQPQQQHQPYGNAARPYQPPQQHNYGGSPPDKRPRHDS